MSKPKTPKAVAKRLNRRTQQELEMALLLIDCLQEAREQDREKYERVMTKKLRALEEKKEKQMTECEETVKWMLGCRHQWVPRNKYTKPSSTT